MKHLLIFKKVLFFSAFLLFLSSAGFTLTIQKTLEWPSLPDDAIAIDDTMVFHSLGDVIKIFNKTSLNFISGISLDTENSIQAIYLDTEQKHIYAAAGMSGIYIIDYTDTNNLQELKTIKNIKKDPGFLLGNERGYINACGISKKDNYLYVADNGYGLRIFDVDNLSKTSEEMYLGGYRQDGQSAELTTGGYFDLVHFTFNSTDYACILDTYFGLKIFDVTNPGSYDNPKDNVKDPEDDPEPVMKKDLTSVYFNQISLVRDLKVLFTGVKWQLFLTDRSATEEKAAVFKFDLFNNSGNPLDSPENLGRCDELLSGNALEINSQNSVIADGDKGFRLVDMTTSHGETEDGIDIYKIKSELNSDSNPGSDFKYSYSIKLDSANVFLADLNQGLTKIDVSDDSAPVETSFNTEHFFSFEKIALSGETFGAVSKDDDISSFYFFNAKNPAQIKLTKKIKKTNPLFIKPLSGNLAGITQNALIAFEPVILNDKVTDVTEKTSLNLTYTPTAAETYDKYIYTGNSNAVNVYSYDSSQLIHHNEFGNSNNITSLLAVSSEKKLYAGTQNNGVIVFDISDPENPQPTELSYNIPAPVKDMTFSSNFLYIAHLEKVTVLNSELMTKKHEIDIENTVNTIDADENFLFAGINKGIKIYTDADKTSYKVLTTHSTKGNVLDMLLKDSHLFSADSRSGFSISEYDKEAGSDPDPLDPSSGESSSCFIKTLF